MDSSVSEPSAPCNGADALRTKVRSESVSQRSDDSRTAADIIRDQMQLEADAREALPYSIDHCTKPLGPLRQSVFACLTCNPPPTNPSDAYNAAGVCYACSVQCHGEHTLVEIFNKRNFTCDCGTTRFPESAPCNLRINPKTNAKGGVHSEEPNTNNKYNQNFRNRFCGCKCEYDPLEQKGTMFQCLGLGTHETGGCGEDWWHPGCVVGLGPRWFESMPKTKVKAEAKDSKPNGALPVIAEDADATEQNGDVPPGEAGEHEEDDDPPPPPGFPSEDDFDGFLCYKCVDAHPWIKRYAGSPGFLAPVFSKQGDADATQGSSPPGTLLNNEQLNGESRKRKAEDDETDSQASKRQKGAGEATDTAPQSTEIPSTSAPATEASKESSPACKLSTLPPAPSGQFSLFFTESFRSHLCHCRSCFPLLAPHPQLLEEEETYEPPVSEDSGSVVSSLYDRGEAALRNIDRVRAIEGVMAYQHLKDKLMPFFQQFAESKQAISAEDIKEYFAKLRGDDQAIKDAGELAENDGADGADFRREQDGY
ncbi:putative zinc finger in N-recognin-domain-containing protein [Chaetomium strumarium]|uniref:Zinc finger in N-recognin-domain-containing protein n=1 Tax=Chaetomium strumarium TaxID=1170767 RepID=A0AAJ0GXD9_9PEZI|nr:putative zinc finger in N-recognin-domain-containing protein [Chaetomium strumarium]